MALGGMLTATAVVIMCLGSIIPVNTYFCPVLCILITRVVGTQKTVAADLFLCEMKPGTYAVLCSDGLTNHVEPEEISEIVRGIGEERSIDEACGTLIDGANGRGGYDNITAVILSV